MPWKQANMWPALPAFTNASARANPRTHAVEFSSMSLACALAGTLVLCGRMQRRGGRSLPDSLGL